MYTHLFILHLDMVVSSNFIRQCRIQGNPIIYIGVGPGVGPTGCAINIYYGKLGLSDI